MTDIVTGSPYIHKDAMGFLIMGISQCSYFGHIPDGQYIWKYLVEN